MNELQLALVAMFALGAIAGPIALTVLVVVGMAWNFTKRYELLSWKPLVTVLPEYIVKETNWRIVVSWYPKAAVIGALIIGNLTVYAIGWQVVIA